MTVLDWSGRDGVQHWGGGQLRACRSCQAPALLLDDQGQPRHKTCAEREAGLAPPAADLIRQRPAGPPAAAPVPEPEITHPGPEAEALW